MCSSIVSLVIGLGAVLINLPDENGGNQGPGNNQASAQAEDKVGFGRLVVTPAPQADNKIQYDSAEEAYQVGAAFHNSRNYKKSRGPMEAAVKLAADDEMRLKAYRALLSAYRQIPEFEPYRDASEFVIAHSKQSAERSLTRNALTSFAYNRGQIDGLIKRYEQMLSQDKNNYLAVFVLSELYSSHDKNPKRAVELLQQLEKLEAKSKPADGAGRADSDVKVAREKAKLAQQLVKSKEFRKAAKIFEEIAPLDATTRAWNLKEAASAWLNDGNKKEALRLANAADATEPESRNEQLAHFFHRNLGDLFMKLDAPKKAVPHYEIAVEKTKIEGYVKDTKASLIEAKEKSK